MQSEKKGKKFDDKKSRLDLIPPKGLLEVGHVMRFGAEKYGEHNWKLFAKEEGWKGRYLAAAMRHLVAILDGEELDPESGLHHAAHAASNTLMLLDLIELSKASNLKIYDLNPNRET